MFHSLFLRCLRAGMPEFLGFIAVLVWALVFMPQIAEANYTIGDANSDGRINVGDPIYLINFIFRDGQAPSPFYAGDANLDGHVNVGDVLYIINHIFRNGPPPGDTGEYEFGVISLYPDDRELLITDSIIITFSDEVDCESISSETIDIGPGFGGTFECDGNKVIVKLARFEFAIMMCIGISKDVRSVTGVNLPYNYYFYIYTSPDLP
ncbi:MAG: dockerin type I repeat-containing protein [candidate division Zixibacteria bacterium]